ncbi:unnamed protein product [Orchesella dallaii]|uniref:F-box domain-containing protein n=1 Tax=Orchesella dallaii TaxID=48710 RepID=A0ABP1Q3C1_9HEXA
MNIDLLVTSTPKSAVEIFSMEVWSNILDNLTCESDIVACYQTCQAWAKYLKPKILMPKVFPFIQKYFTPPSEFIPSFPGSEEAANRRHKTKQFQLSTIFNIRRTSRFWKKAVDDYYQAIAALESGTEDIFHEAYEFGHDIAKLENFVAKGFSTDSTHANPIITRSISFKDYFGNYYNHGMLKEQGRILIKTILEAFGSQIWVCTLEFPYHTDVIELYEVVHTYVSLMPNLKTLHVLYSDNPRVTHGRRPSFFDRLQSSQLPSLVINNVRLQTKPFPRLEHLNLLTLNSIYYPLTNGILKENTHVQVLKVRNCGADWLDYVYPNVEKLELEDSCVVFQQLQHQSWPLKVLKLHTGERETLKVMFEVFSTFGDTLEQLSFTHWNGWQQDDDDEEVHELKLELPHLKKLVFAVPNFHLNTIDFLLGCTALQEIKLEIAIFDVEKDNIDGQDEEDDEDDEDDEEDEDDLNDSTASNSSSEDEDATLPPATLIEFFECISTMENSNIWHFLPMLNYLEICTVYGKKSVLWGVESSLNIHSFGRGEDGTAMALDTRNLTIYEREATCISLAF